MSMWTRKFFGCAAVLGALALGSSAAGCAVATDGGPSATDDALDPNAPFVAVSKAGVTTGATPQAAGVRLQSLRALAGTSDANEDFYLAINKKELGQRWFLSAFLKQFFPGAVGSGAARTLGTRVVTFKVQNDRLYVFDVDDRKKTSDNFDPDILVDAYPIVKELRSFSTKKGSEQFVLFDPSAGLAEFGVVSDAFGAGATKYKVDLKYMQRFRKIGDGVTYEQVFTGVTDQPSVPAPPGPVTPDTLEENQLRASGTLGIALRRYTEGEGFKNVVMPLDDPSTPQVDESTLGFNPLREHYFRSDPQIVPNTGELRQFAAKWNIRPGMKPIRWVIGNPINIAQEQFKDKYDIIGAVKRGIEGWNTVFGFQVFTAEVGNPDDSWADDDTNMLIWENDPSLAFAFANWRSNPNTGETRGASVFMNNIWIPADDDPSYEDDPPATPAPAPATSTARVEQKLAALKPRPEARFLSWGGLKEYRACEFLAPQFRPEGIAGLTNPPPGTPLTRRQKVENLLTHVVAHEVGHTLGLRHNFKGSIVGGAGTSVMEYVLDEFSIRAPYPLAYDKAAVDYLYGLSNTLPPQPFCTDDSTVTDPNCNQYDLGQKPLEEYFGPNWLAARDIYFSLPPARFQALQAALTNFINARLNPVLQYVRAGTPDERALAWQTAINGLTLPLDPAKAGTLPNFRERSDALVATLFRRLYLDPPAARGSFRADPPRSDAAFLTAFLAEARANLTAPSTVRTFATRRLMVDVLKKMQLPGALAALRDSRLAVQQERLNLSGEAAAEADDLLARIDAAITPYYN